MLGLFFNVQSRLRTILAVSDSDKREAALCKLASELGCSLASTYHAPSGKHLEEEVVRRIQEAARTVREARMWLLTVISALVALLSAVASWVAVLKLH